MSDTPDTSPSSTPPTPEAHGNREGSQAAHEPDAPLEAGGEEQLDEQAEPTDLEKIKGIIEALLFASDEPLDPKTIGNVLTDVGEDVRKRALQHLKLEYSGTHRGIHLAEVAGGYQLRTNPDFKDHILEMYESKPRKLSRAAMETLAIIAYQQPLTRADVEEIRGVDSSGVIRTLEDHELVHTIGRLDDLGRPHIYGTTERFLEFFGLESLADLPTLDESEMQNLEEMYEEELANAEAQSAAASEDSETAE